jgi:hypothetical protein
MNKQFGKASQAGKMQRLLFIHCLFNDALAVKCRMVLLMKKKLQWIYVIVTQFRVPSRNYYEAEENNETP